MTYKRPPHRKQSQRKLAHDIHVVGGRTCETCRKPHSVALKARKVQGQYLCTACLRLYVNIYLKK